MQKMMYETPSLQIVLFIADDVIKTSGEQDGVKSGDDNLFDFSGFLGGVQ